MSNPSIKILSWNTCWGCQKADQTSINDGTSTFLANQCYELKQPNKVPLCQDNVEKLIIPNTSAELYDIIFLQEYVKTSLEDKLVAEGYDLCKGQVMDEGIATFFKADRFKKLNTTDIIDNIQTDGKAGRGFQIIFVQDKKTKEYYALLNIHNGKKIVDSYKNGLQARISAILHNKISVLNRVLSSEKLIKYIHVIFGGDFNDGPENEPKDTKSTDVDNFRNYWKGIKPFSQLSKSTYSVVNGLRNVNVSTKKLIPPPKTCCTGRVFIRNPHIANATNVKMQKTTEEAKAAKDNITDREGDKLYGDYILISDGLKYVDDVKIVDNQMNPSSDHLAVTCTINLVDSMPKTAQPYSTNNKYLKYKNKYLNLKKLIN